MTLRVYRLQGGPKPNKCAMKGTSVPGPPGMKENSAFSFIIATIAVQRPQSSSLSAIGIREMKGMVGELFILRY